jgi:hypothetical protein|nr:MAG TPA: hypothetical protein [Caudoviricetes sp.]
MANINANVKFFAKLDDLASGKRLEEFVQRQAEECWEQIVTTTPPQVQTGQYIASIQVRDVQRSGNEIFAEVFTDLRLDWHNVFLAELLEHGTGIYREDGTGRQTPWTYYNDRWKRFVFTRGIKPMPHWTPAYQMQTVKMKEGLRHVFN